MKRIILYILLLYALIICCSFSTPIFIKVEKPLSPNILSADQANVEIANIPSVNLEFNYYIFHSSDLK